MEETKIPKAKMTNAEITERMNYLKELEQKIEKSALSEKNKQTLLSFRDWLVSQGLSLVRIKLYLSLARTIAQMGDKDLQDYKKIDVDSVMTKIHLCGRYKSASINVFIVTFKVLFRFIDGIGFGEQSPRTKHLKQKKSSCSLRREDLLTDDDVSKLISAASGMKNGLMYSCLLSVLYETGCRPGEIRNILLKDVAKDAHGYSITIEGMGGKRVVLSITSAPMLAKWLDAHAFKETPEHPLFYYVTKGEPRHITIPALNRTIRSLSLRVLGRAVNPYVLRCIRLEQYLLEKLKLCDNKAFGTSITPTQAPERIW